MSWLKPPIMEWAKALWHTAEPFVPGLLGALVAQMVRPGLGIKTRFVQWSVSVIVFHFVSLAVLSVFHWPKAIGDVVGFFIAFIAFEALHAWQKAAVEAGTTAIRDFPLIFKTIVESWGKRPGTTPAPTEGE